jgi:hypothetical protein
MLHDQLRLDELGHRAALKILAGTIVAMDRLITAVPKQKVENF